MREAISMQSKAEGGFVVIKYLMREAISMQSEAISMQSKAEGGFVVIKYHRH